MVRILSALQTCEFLNIMPSLAFSSMSHSAFPNLGKDRLGHSRFVFLFEIALSAEKMAGFAGEGCPQSVARGKGGFSFVR